MSGPQHPASSRLSSLTRALGALGPIEEPADVARALERLASTGALDLPLPAHGDTRGRFAALAAIAAADLSLARLAEGHVDARAILAEARRPARSARYGVWAAEPPDARVEAERTRDGWILRGRKRYASGARGLQRALVTARAPDGDRLFDVDLARPGVVPVPDTWRAVGMAATESLDVRFEDVLVDEGDAVGDPGFYVDRPGFWHGAVGVAACWFGGALGALRSVQARLARGADAHQAAHLGAIAAACASMQSTLDAAADAIDADPRDLERGGRVRALIARHIVEQACQEVLARAGRAGGTAPLTFDRAHARRAADLIVYLRQHHAERDLADLGRAVIEGDACAFA